MIKIIAGEFRSRQLLTPEDDSISRPYSARVKESVFDLLRGWFEGATVVDLFAGVGTIGLEALSRGAACVVMVERHRAVFDLLRKNIEALGCADRAVALHADAMGPVWFDKVPRPADLIFVDPPYELMSTEPSRTRVLDQIAKCRPLMGDRGFVVLRSPLGMAEADLHIPGFHGPEERRYGQDMRLLLYVPAPIADEDRTPATPDGSGCTAQD